MSLVVSRLSQRADLFEAARGVLREYILLPDGWEALGLGPSDAEAFLMAEMRSFPGPATPPRGEVLLATEVGRIIALGEVVPFDGETCELKRVYVVPGRQGTGIGTTLAIALLDEARALGYSTALLEVLPPRTRARQFWESLGFEATEPFRDYPFPMQFLRRSLEADGRTAPDDRARPSPRRG